MANGVKNGSDTTEFKLALVNKLLGFGLVVMAVLLEYKGKDAAQMMTVGVGLLLGTQILYTAARTLVKNAAAKANGNGAPPPAG